MTLANSGYSYINRILVPIYSDKVYIYCDKTEIADWTDEEYNRYVGIKPF
jgi:hypothetical protein